MKNSLWILNLLVFISAFLLFQIEPMIAKTLLPFYGGSYFVWGACVVFFQGMLLAGYLFAHWGLKKFGMVRYQYIHIVLLLLTLIVFPGRALGGFHPHHNLPVAIDIFGQLLFSIGPVFFVLSTFSIILQAWLVSSNLKQKINPYFLYAISNLGSFTALLTYPFIFEMLFDLDVQFNMWRGGFLFLLALQIALIKLYGIKNTEIEKEEAGQPVRREEIYRWFLLGAGGSITFLSVTTLITTEIAPFPLAWIVPLSIYLLSFVLNFKSIPWCPAWIKNQAHLLFAFSLLMFFITLRRMLPFPIEIGIYMFLVFAICMYCQNELIIHRPSKKSDLSLFYVVISLGSFIGSLVITWIVPLVSIYLIEYLIGLGIISFSFFIGQPRQKISGYDMRLIIYLNTFLFLWPLKFEGYHLFSLGLLLFTVGMLFREFKKKPFVLHLAIITVCVFSPYLERLWGQGGSFRSENYVCRHRNYYGMSRIYDALGTRFFLHGTTLHGGQKLAEGSRSDSITYYHSRSPSGELLSSKTFDFKRIGVIGLGAGSLAVFGDPTDQMDFFEIDGDVEQMAKDYFTYLKDSKADTKVFLGDARISLEGKIGRNYDLLVFDAFSGESVPSHLLTVEAIKLYRQVIRPDGLILLNVSNHYLNIPPVLASNAHEVGAYYAYKENPAIDFTRFASQWVILTWNPNLYQKLVDELDWKPFPENQKHIRPWTDQYTNIVARIKTAALMNSMKTFTPFKW